MELNNSKIDLIDEKSEQVREILSKTPSWVVSWGTSVVFVVVIVLVMLSYVVEYPDVINSEVTIMTKNPPLDVVARVDGRLNEILVKENDRVERNTILGIIENTARTGDMLFLKNFLKEANIDALSNLPPDEKLVLGEVQESYNQFLKSYNELVLFQKLRAEEVQIRSMKKRLHENETLITKLNKQLKLFDEELQLVENDYKRSQHLFKEKVISEKDFEERQKEYLQAKRNVESLDGEISRVRINTLDLEQAVEGLGISRIEKDNRFFKAFHDSHKTLEQAISKWEERYLLISATSGRIAFFDFWSAGQFVKNQDVIFTIVPEQDSEVIGRLMLPVLNSGKVKRGQAVNIKLDNYPYYEFGMLKGEIVNISLVPKRDKYAIEIKLPNGLNTTFNKKLEFKQAMKGTAEVITEDITLLERIFFQIRKLFTRQ